MVDLTRERCGERERKAGGCVKSEEEWWGGIKKALGGAKVMTLHNQEGPAAPTLRTC